MPTNPTNDTHDSRHTPWVVRTFIEGLSYNVGPLDPVMPPEFEGYASEPPHHVYVIVKDSKERAEFVANACNSHHSLVQEVARLREAMGHAFTILDELEGSFDEQTFDEKKREDFDAPDDREYSVNITAKQLRAISKARAALESPSQAMGGK